MKMENNDAVPTTNTLNFDPSASFWDVTSLISTDPVVASTTSDVAVEGKDASAAYPAILKLVYGCLKVTKNIYQGGGNG